MKRLYPRGHVLGGSWPGVKPRQLRIQTQPTRWQRIKRWLGAVRVWLNTPSKGLL